MAAYRVPEFTLEQRVDVASHMLNPDREWGLVSKLAGLHGVSRTLLYEIRDHVLEAIGGALLPRDAGRRAQVNTLLIASLTQQEVMRRIFTG